MRKHAARPHTTHRLFRGHAGVLLFAVLAVGGALSLHARAPLSSPEVQFADSSPGGMQIVPASCASSVAHFYGECSPASPPCTVTVTPSTIPTGGGTVSLSWHTGEPYPDTVAVNGWLTAIGAVYPSGTLTIAAPPATTVYTLSGSAYDTTGASLGTFSCSATLTVTAPSSNPLYINKVELGRAPGSTVAVGDIIAYRMYIANESSQTQTNMRVTDAVPTNTHLIWQGGGTDSNSASPVGTAGGTTIWWNQSSAGANWGGYVDFSVQVDSGAANGTSICNKASVSSDQWAATPVNSQEICNPVSTPVCTAYLDWVPANGPAYRAWGSLSNKRINYNTYNTVPICVINSSGNIYFVPAKTPLEMHSFQDHPPTGVTLTPI